MSWVATGTAAVGVVGSALGGGAGGGGGGLMPSQSGDSSAGQTSPFNYNASFQVGGSGKQSLAQKADNGTASGEGASADKTALYIVSGIAGLAVIGIIVYAIRSK